MPRQSARLEKSNLRQKSKAKDFKSSNPKKRQKANVKDFDFSQDYKIFHKGPK